MQQKIAIIMLTPYDNKQLYALHINMQYANSNNYDFIIEKCIDEENKLAIYTKYLPHYNYILIINANNIIFKNSLSIQPIIDKYMNDTKVIALSNDWDEHFLKSKIILLKNCSTTFEILNYWDNYAVIGDELNLAYEIYYDNIVSTKFALFDTAENLWSNYFYTFEYISNNLITIGLITTLIFYKFVIKF